MYAAGMSKTGCGIADNDFQAASDKSCKLFELSSGCKLHRNPASNKCKFLALGMWKVSLQCWSSGMTTSWGLAGQIGLEGVLVTGASFQLTLWE